MPGFDDPRYLQQVITKLQADVKKLQKDTLPLLSYQRGPTPGWMNAGQVGPGPAQKSAMHIHMDGNQIGVAPRQTVTDASGVVRVELGNLAANGISLAQYGFRANRADGTPNFDSSGLISGLLRVNDGTRDRVQIGNLAAYTDPLGVVSPAGYGIRVLDASGNIIFDTLGAAIVMKSLGITDVTNQTFTSATFATVTGSGVTFTLARQTDIFAPFLGTGNVATNNGNVGFLRARLTSAPNSTSGNENFGVLANFAQTSSGWLYIGGLAAGTYTIQLDAAVNATPQTFNLIEAALQVFKLGG